MLSNLHVKNLALIDEIEVEFTKGLNILTGETGAGKSIVIGSINLALGGKMSKDFIRNHASYGLVELVFQVDNPIILEKLKSLDIFLEEGQLIISRKVMEGRSISKINGETVPLSKVKEVSKYLLDIHGQHEHQSLLYAGKQLEILDEFGKEKLEHAKEEVEKAYLLFEEKKKEFHTFDLEEANRLKEISFLEYECKEIRDANLKTGEDLVLEDSYRRMIHSKQMVENLSEVHNHMGYDSRSGVGDLVNKSLRAIKEVSHLENKILQMQQMLLDIDNLINEFNHEVSSFMNDLTFSNEEFLDTEQRLNLVNALKAKYGQTIEDIFLYESHNKEKLELLYDYNVKREKAKLKLDEAKKILEEQCENLSTLRKEQGNYLESAIKAQLIDLNFLQVDFGIEFLKLDYYSKNGFDQISYMISTNPGEDKKPLHSVVSGGELSRIMLAIKTLLAEKDDTQTLIFDEIDTGISGRTAQKVSEKMSLVACGHQVICITHLAQIAAMADSHFEIIKIIEGVETSTNIRRLDEESTVLELARIIGGAKITPGILESAKEMKDLASVQKNTRLK